MDYKTFDKYINNHLQVHKWLYFLSILFICTGFVIGIYSMKYMNPSLKNDLISYFTSFSRDNLNYNSVLISSLKNNIPLILFIWFLGLTIVGVPFILIIEVIKGFTFGFTFSFFINNFGFKGVTFSLLGIVPQNIIYFSVIIFISVVSMNFSLKLLKEGNSWKNHLVKRITAYTTVLIPCIIILVIGCLIETYVVSSISINLMF